MKLLSSSGLECSKTMDVIGGKKGKRGNKGFWNVLVTGKFLSFYEARRLCLAAGSLVEKPCSKIPEIWPCTFTGQ